MTEVDTEIYSKANDSTDSFYNTYTLSVLSIRKENPNLQTIAEHKRTEPPPVRHRTAPPTPTPQSPHTSNSSSLRYSFQAQQITPLSSDVDQLTKSLQRQNFWKYHIMLVGKNEFYLTTNPDIKHLYCRNGPGYFVQLILPRIPQGVAQNKRQSEMGYRVIFKRQNYDELDSEDNLKEPEECIVVTKASKEDGGAFSIVLKLINGINNTTIEDGKIIKNVAVEKPIDELQQLLKKDPRNVDLQKMIPTFHRYELELNDKSWFIGSNPIAKQRTSNKLKINSEIFKLTGKQNVYFFNKPTDSSKPLKISKRHSFMKSLRSESSKTLPPQDETVVALFRPHERRRLKKKMIKAINSNVNGTGSVTAKSPVIDEYNYIENDQYYKPGDGLTQTDPKDDDPNDYKLGWITIFDDDLSHDMWELVLGYTFAIGFDRMIDEYIREV